MNEIASNAIPSGPAERRSTASSRRSRQASLGAVVIAGVFALARPTLADEPPEPGFIEHCVVEEVQREGEECMSHREWAFAREAPNYLGQSGYCRRCRTYGATYAEWIYCRPQGSADLPAGWEKVLPEDPVPPDEKGTVTVPECKVARTTPKSAASKWTAARRACGCGLAPVEEGSSPLVLALGVASAAMLRRRSALGERARSRSSEPASFEGSKRRV